jgi:hypothetical protein
MGRPALLSQQQQEKETMSTRVWSRVLAGLAVAAGLVLTTSVAAAQSADKVMVLDKAMGGVLAPSPDMQGKFAYYKVRHPGDGSALTINLHAWPDDAAVLQNAGFRVYGPSPDKLYGWGGLQTAMQPNISGDLITSEPGEYVIQVFSYDAQTPIQYTISTAGMVMAPPSTATVAVAGAAATRLNAPVSGQPASTTSTSLNKGKLAASPDGQGRFAIYQFTYPGDASTYTVNVRVTPDDAGLLGLAGFRIYGPQPDVVYATGGGQPGMEWNVSADLIATDPGTYVVQVFNWNPDREIDFEVSLAR